MYERFFVVWFLNPLSSYNSNNSSLLIYQYYSTVDKYLRNKSLKTELNKLYLNSLFKNVLIFKFSRLNIFETTINYKLCGFCCLVISKVLQTMFHVFMC